MSKKYDVAAYIWPAYTGDELRRRMFWTEGNGEWQSVKNSKGKRILLEQKAALGLSEQS